MNRGAPGARSLWGIFAATACCLLAGCMVGPDFKAPAGPQLSGFEPKVDKGAPEVPAGGEKDFHLQAGKDIAAEWWAVFHSPQLDSLIKQSFEHNPDLGAAQASLRVAMENVKAQAGAFYPVVSVGFNASRNKQSAELSPVLASPALLYNLYQTQVSVSWTPDIWGGNKRAVEALQAQADAQHFQLQAAYVGLASNLVATAIDEASLREQIKVTRDLIGDQQRILAIEKRQKALGQISGQDVAAQETVLAQTEALLPALQKQLEQRRDLLTVLAGRYPVDQVEQSFRIQEIALPHELPVSVPSKLVEQRADIRMAQENMHAASAEVGVATADMLPNITLAGNMGALAPQIGQLFDAGNGLWSLGAGLAQPLFDGNTLLHRKRASEAILQQASFQYRSTVLRAFQDVADTLSAIENDAAAERSAQEAERAAARSLSFAEAQLTAGQVSGVTVLSAEAAYAQTRIASITARANRLSDSAALFQALGGGWWNRPDPVAVP